MTEPNIDRGDDAPLSAAKRKRKSKALESENVEGFELVGRTVTINRPRTELYAVWRDFRNLALFMENIERVEVIAKLFQKEPKIQARRDLRRFKQLMETGEIATSEPPFAAPRA